jgi:osmotically inducible lipoprotein OsmB
MNLMQKLSVTATAVVLLFGLGGCTLIGVGVGAVAGSGTPVGILGGAVIGGVIGHEISD